MGGCSSTDNVGGESQMNLGPNQNPPAHTNNTTTGRGQHEYRQSTDRDREREPLHRENTRGGGHEYHRGENRATPGSHGGQGGQRSAPRYENASSQGSGMSRTTQRADHRNGNGDPARDRRGSNDGKGHRRGRLEFPEFSDREKDAVDRIMEQSPHLYMAKINFEDLKLIKSIGTGAFGEVIKGEYCGTPVVIKRMLRNKIDEANMKMFAEEIQLMMGLRHPNIVQFIGASWNSYSNICFITEFLDRGDLFNVLRDSSVKLKWAEPLVRMAIDTSRGMAYLHSMNPPIIHRDLKSMNILVSSTFSCKVSDFGLSRTKSVDETMSVTGTPLWLPPEMIRGERYTEKVDVFSFGIVLTEMDTRKIPYWDVKAKGARKKKVSGSTLMHMVAYEGLRPSVSATCPKSVKALIDRCVADNDQDRPPFGEIIREFETVIKEEALKQKEEEESLVLSGRSREDLEKEDRMTAEELGVKLPKRFENGHGAEHDERYV